MIPVFKSHFPLWAFALLLTASETQAATWFSLEVPLSASAITVEVDLESMRSSGEKRNLVTRIIYPQPQKKQDISFQSVIAELEISCDTDLDIWKSVSFFQSSNAKGIPLSSENLGTAGIPRSVLKLLPDKAWGTLQRSACGRTATTDP